VELADCIKILDRYFEQQFGKGSNFYKQAWLPVKRASKPVELSTTAPNIARDEICPAPTVPCGYRRYTCIRGDVNNCAIAAGKLSPVA